MKTMKRILCLALALSVVFAMTGCNKSPFSHDAVRKWAKAEDFDECDEIEDLFEVVGTDTYAYVTATKRDARNLFNTIIYTVQSDKPKYDFTKVTALYSQDDDGMCFIIAATFEDRKDAEKFFEKYTNRHDFENANKFENEDKGEEKSYSYYIANAQNFYTKTTAIGLYQSGNTVIWIRSVTEDTEMAGNFCEHFNLISPMDA